MNVFRHRDGMSVAVNFKVMFKFFFLHKDWTKIYGPDPVGECSGMWKARSTPELPTEGKVAVDYLITRNPYDRFLSFYHNKIYFWAGCGCLSDEFTSKFGQEFGVSLRGMPSPATRWRGLAIPHGAFPVGTAPKPPSVSDAAVFCANNKGADYHIIPQSACLSSVDPRKTIDKESVSSIGTETDFSDYVNHYPRAFGLSEESANAIHQAYQEDFEAFGYAKDSWKEFLP